jgi:hypothetical protein
MARYVCWAANSIIAGNSIAAGNEHQRRSNKSFPHPALASAHITGELQRQLRQLGDIGRNPFAPRLC